MKSSHRLPTRWVHTETAWQHLRRSPYQALATIVVLSISFFVITIFVLLAAGSEMTLRLLEAKPQVTAFFTTPPDPQNLEQLKGQLLATGFIERLQYVSQEEALQIYKEQNIKDPLLLEMVTANILPASLEVSTKQPESLSQVAEILSLHEDIEEVIFQKDIIEQLVKWTKFLRMAGTVLISLLAVTTFLIIFIVIGMKIALRRTEVEILRLLGASSGYIQWPFVLEGWFYGMFGAVIGWGLTYLAIIYTTPYMLDLVWSLKIFPVPIEWMLAILIVEMIAGGLWSAVASLWAVSRYLKRV